MQYKLFQYKDGNQQVRRTDGDVHTFIPFVADNTDYQAYLKWLEEGNTPEPAEEQQ